MPIELHEGLAGRTVALSCQNCGQTTFRLVRDVGHDGADVLYAECCECRTLNGSLKMRE